MSVSTQQDTTNTYFCSTQRTTKYVKYAPTLILKVCILYVLAMREMIVFMQNWYSLKDNYDHLILSFSFSSQAYSYSLNEIGM